MNTREASISSVDRSVPSIIDVMDIIPREIYFERAREIPIKYRHALGRAAIDESVGINLKPIDVLVRDPREDLFRSEADRTPISKTEIAVGRTAVNQTDTHNKVWRFIDRIGINSEEQRVKDGALLKYFNEKRNDRRTSKGSASANTAVTISFSEDHILPVSISQAASGSQEETEAVVDMSKVTSLSEHVKVRRPRKKNKTTAASSSDSETPDDGDGTAKWNVKSLLRSEHDKKQEKQKNLSRLSKLIGRIAAARTTALRRTDITAPAIDASKNTPDITPDIQVAPVVQLPVQALPIAPVIERFIPSHNDLTGIDVDELSDSAYSDDLMDMIDDAFADVTYPDDLTDMMDDMFGGSDYSGDLSGTLIYPSIVTPRYEDIEDIFVAQDRTRGLLSRTALRAAVGVPLIAAIGILSSGSQTVQAESQIEKVAVASAAAEAFTDRGMQVVALPEQSSTRYIIDTPAPAPTQSSTNGSGRPPVSSNSVLAYGSSNSAPEAAVAQPAPHSEVVSSAPAQTQAPVSTPKRKKNPPVESTSGNNGSGQGSGAAGSQRVSNGEVFTFVTGGATDDSSGMFMNTLIETGNEDPAKTKLIPTVSPKDMAPFAGGPLYTDQSVAITRQVLMDNIRAVLKTNPNAQIRLANFSEGNMAGNAVANELLKEGINVQVDAYGNPESAIGMQNKSSAANPIVKPFMDKLGIVGIPNVPYTVNIFDGDDMWATSAGDGALTTIDKLTKIPTNHRVIDRDNETPIQTFRIGTEVYMNYGTRLVAIPPNAVDITGERGPEFNKFRPDSPLSNIGTDPSQAPIPGPADLPNPDPNLIALPLPGEQQAPIAPGSEKSPIPSFFGEQPCFAPDGSQYFTPADAPC